MLTLVRAFLKGLAAGCLLTLAAMLIVFGLLYSSNAKAEETEHWAGLTLRSYHLNRERGYNETNVGPFYERRVSRDWGWQAGLYRNSFDRDTYYVWAKYHPLHFSVFGARVSAGGAFGAGTGYAMKKERQPDGSMKRRESDNLLPLLAASATIRLGRHLAANVYAVPSVVAVQAMWRFD
jgi:hypothetical protein